MTRRVLLHVDMADPAYLVPHTTIEALADETLVTFFDDGFGKGVTGYVAWIEEQPYLLYSTHPARFDHNTNIGIVMSRLEPSEVDKLRRGESVPIRAVGKAILDLE